MQKIHRLFPYLAIVVTILSLVACGSSGGNTGTAVTPTPTSATATATPTPSTHHFMVGETVKVGDTWNVTITSAKTSPSGQYVHPQKAGDVFLVFDVTVKNISTQEQNISSIAQFHLTDASGQQYMAAYDDAAAPTLDGKVEAGSPLKGYVTFEVPSSVKAFLLSFEAVLFSPGQTIWDIHV